MAEQLNTVFHIHPTFPSGDRDPLHKGNYVSSVEKSLGSAGSGWHMETGLHILKLLQQATSTSSPTSKYMIGHTSELLPFQLERVAKFAGGGAFRERQRGLICGMITFGLLRLACLA